MPKLSKETVVWLLVAAIVALAWAMAARAQEPEHFDADVGPPPLVRIARADTAPPLPSAQSPAPPVAADLAPPAAIPVPAPAAVIHLAVPAAAPAPPQTVTIQLVTSTAAPAAPAPPAQADTAPAAVVATLRHAGPVRRAIGNFGEWLALAKRDKLLIPASTAVVHTVTYQVQVPAVVPPPAPAPPPAQALLASPQSVPTKSPGPAGGLLFRR